MVVVAAPTVRAEHGFAAPLSHVVILVQFESVQIDQSEYAPEEGLRGGEQTEHNHLIMYFF